MNNNQALAIIAAIIRLHRGETDDNTNDMSRAIAEAREYLKAAYRAMPIVLDEV